MIISLFKKIHFFAVTQQLFTFQVLWENNNCNVCRVLIFFKFCVEHYRNRYCLRRILTIERLNQFSLQISIKMVLFLIFKTVRIILTHGSVLILFFKFWHFLFFLSQFLSQCYILLTFWPLPQLFCQRHCIVITW